MICAICPTLNRPELLSRSIACFEHQTYEDRYLLIVDDIGQYNTQHGDRWSLISFNQRILSLGEKNNVCASMAPRGVKYYAKWDDDDIYMPWHLEGLVRAMEQGGELVQPRHAVDYWFDRWVQTETFSKKDPDHYCYHGCWGYTRELFARVGGYRAKFAGDDGELQHRLRKLSVRSVDSGCPTSYWYNRPLENRISEAGGSEDAYFDMAPKGCWNVGDIVPWAGEAVWKREVPQEIIERQW